MMDFFKAKTIHFTGIKGVGMTSLALCADDLGKKVSGSDTDEVFPTDKVLKRRKLKVKIGFTADLLPKKLDLLIYTGAHDGQKNPQVVAALERGVAVLNYGQALGQITKGKKLIATAGVGGKSSTAAMLAVLMDASQLKPSFSVGVGDIFPLNTCGRYLKKSAYFVAETDEFVSDPSTDPTPKFHYLSPYLAIITNVEHDHPDIYPDLKSVFASFNQFLAKVPQDGLIILNIDNHNNQQFIKQLSRPVLTYGFSPQADWRITNYHHAHQKQLFSLQNRGVNLGDFVLNVPGQYNVLNAAAAAAAAYFLGVKIPKIQLGLKSFLGTRRRFELIKIVKGIDLYDDYAHHPIEISALITAARKWFPGRRLVTIFQSHTFSRTKTLLSQFANSLSASDIVLVNQIFSSARETDNLGISGKTLADKTKLKNSQTFYCPGKVETLAFLKNHAKKGDVVFTVGAGNNWLWHRDMIKCFQGL